MTEGEKREITWKFSAAISARDINLLKAILTDDIVWSLPGKNLMSGRSARRGGHPEKGLTFLTATE